MHNILETLLELRHETDERKKGLNITTHPEVSPLIQALTARRAELNNLLAIMQAWDEAPPENQKEVQEYMRIVEDLRPRIEELKRNPYCAGNHTQFINK